MIKGFGSIHKLGAQLVYATPGTKNNKQKHSYMKFQNRAQTEKG